VDKVLDYSSYLNISEREESPFYNDSLCPKLWVKNNQEDGNPAWTLDGRASRKIEKIAKEFFSHFSSLLKQKDISDIQITGDLANFSHTPNSNLDVHILVDLDGMDDLDAQDLKNEIAFLKSNWDLKNSKKIRGRDVDFYIQNAKDPHDSSGLYSVLNGEWIKAPSLESPSFDERDVAKKYDAIAHEIDSLETQIEVTNSPDRVKFLRDRATELKIKIQQMRKDAITKSGQPSVGSSIFKMLRKEGYIEKLIDVLSNSYDKIYKED